VPRPGCALIAAPLDRSGSMQSIRTDTEGGFNAFIETQRKEPGDVHVTLAQFDDRYDLVYAGKPIADVPPLVLEPRGMTALLDGIGKLVTDVGAELAARPEDERPEKVIVMVLTDGHENASREWRIDGIRSLIKQQEDTYSWEFLFFGADMDAVSVGRSMGFAADRSLSYGASAQGVGGAYAAAASYTSRARSGGSGVRTAGFRMCLRRAWWAAQSCQDGQTLRNR
jgi:hypothetical protein